MWKEIKGQYKSCNTIYYLKGLLKVLGLIYLPIAVNYYMQSSLFSFSNSGEEVYTSGFLATLWWTTVLLYVIEILLVAIVGNTVVGMLMFGVIFGIFGYANKVKVDYRTEPIYPEELKMITEPKLLQEMISKNIFYLLIGIVVVVIAIFLYFIYRSRKQPTWQKLLRVGVIVLMLLTIGEVLRFNKEGNFYRERIEAKVGWTPWHQIVMYRNTGFVSGFLYNLKGDVMKAPENYSKEEVAQIVKRYENEEDSALNIENKPNIVYIMDESFSDPSHLNGVEYLGESPLRKLDELADRIVSGGQGIRGNMLSSGYGGGTANIEFEALTGFTMEALNPQIITPYTQVVPQIKTFPSIVSYLNKLKYDTIAIHPYNETMYKRKEVYNTFGFNQFISERGMTHTDKSGNSNYISDSSSFEEVFGLLNDNEDTPKFIHLVTMQGHMPYKEKYEEEDLRYVTNVDDTNEELPYYSNDVAEISEAFSNFLEKLSDIGRETIVVFWGDHLPGIWSEDILNSNESWVTHETPVIFYNSKNPIEESTEGMKVENGFVLSPIYYGNTVIEMANLQKSGFYRMMSAMEQELPAFEKQMYLINNGDFGNTYRWKEKLSGGSKKAKEIYKEYSMIEYDILQGKQYSLNSGFFE